MDVPEETRRGDGVTQGAAQGRAWNLSTSTPCHGLLSRPLEKTQGAERFYSCGDPESALLVLCCWGASDISHQPQRAGGRIPQASGGSQGGLGRRKGKQSSHNQGLALSVLKQASSCPFSRPQSPHLCNKEQELDQGVRNPNTKGVAAGTQCPRPTPRCCHEAKWARGCHDFGFRRAKPEVWIFTRHHLVFQCL